MASSKIMEDIKQKYQEKMVNELNKFLCVYNELSQTSVTFSMDDYPFIIRVLGNYVSRLDLDNWQESEMSFGTFTVSMSVFKNTIYEEKVHQFVKRLKDAFIINLDGEIIDYLENTKDFTEEEKLICIGFHERASNLNRAMKKEMFGNVTSDVLSKEVISEKYANELREFNEYTHFASSRPDVARVIKRFDMAVKTLASKKSPTEIFFDV